MAAGNALANERVRDTKLGVATGHLGCSLLTVNQGEQPGRCLAVPDARLEPTDHQPRSPRAMRRRKRTSFSRVAERGASSMHVNP